MELFWVDLGRQGNANMKRISFSEPAVDLGRENIAKSNTKYLAAY